MNQQPENNNSRKSPQGGRQPFYPWNTGQENSYRMWVVTGVVLFFLAWSMYLSQAGPEKINYTSFLKQLNAGNVARVTIKGDKITGLLKQKAHKQAEQANGEENAGSGKGSAYKHFVTYLPSFGDPDLIDVLQSHDVEVETQPKSDTNWLYMILTLLPFVVLIWIIYAQFRQFQGQSGGDGLFSIGKSRARLYDRSQESTRFDDVAGAEGAKT